MKRWIRTIAAATVALAVAVALSACDPLTTSLPWSFGEVDRVVSDLGVKDSGEVLLDGYSGGGIAGPPPTYAAVLDSTDARDVIESSLLDADYNQESHDADTGFSTWSGIGPDAGYVSVILGVMHAGEMAGVNTGKPIRLTGDATFVSVGVYPK